MSVLVRMLNACVIVFLNNAKCQMIGSQIQTLLLSLFVSRLCRKYKKNRTDQNENRGRVRVFKKYLIVKPLRYVPQ